METFAIIPARAGSRGIPLKNFKPLNGLSPLDRAIRCCQQAGIIPFVASDLPEPEPYLADGWLGWFHQPALHDDACSMVRVVLDVLSRMPASWTHFLLVQPTQPLRQPKHLHRAMELLQTHQAVASIVETEPARKLFYRSGEAVLWGDRPVERRQDARPTYYCDGTFYGCERDWFLQHQTFRPSPDIPRYVLEEIPKSETCRLDDREDWLIAEERLRVREAFPTPTVDHSGALPRG